MNAIDVTVRIRMVTSNPSDHCDVLKVVIDAQPITVAFASRRDDLN